MSPTPASLILGTAGHIDHGKTSLVRALSGVDTDRLAEEKRRGITIELGFARYDPGEGCAFGIVDVPGHEGFVKTMVAGAAGMDIVLMVVAADEGVMPQTREHLAIVRLLGVAGMVVAITKADLVEPEWLDLVREDVEDFLAGTPYESAEIVPTSVETGAGVEALSRALLRCGSMARGRAGDDLVRLPVDRVFALEGAGTVVTGTLWSGRLPRGGIVRILPRGEEARVRAVQVHGEAVDHAEAGMRTAVALTGAAVRRGMVARGDVLVSTSAWTPSMMLTVELTVLEGSSWRVKAGQRVRVHLGTVEVMARVALFGLSAVEPGESALAQLRLEAHIVARSGDRFVIRSYSPVTTIAGGVVLEPSPPKRKRLSGRERAALAALARRGTDAVRGAVFLAGWAGLDGVALGVQAGWKEATHKLPPGLTWQLGGTLFDSDLVSRGETRILEAVDAYHGLHPLEAGAPLRVLRTALPGRIHAKLADGLAARLVRKGRLVVEGKSARLPGFKAALSPDETVLADQLTKILRTRGLQGPSTKELAAQLADDPRIGAVLGFMAGQGQIRLLGDAYWVTTEALNRISAEVVRRFGGREGLGPADFREVIPVTRKHLMPILAYLDGRGVTVRQASGRRVAGA